MFDKEFLQWIYDRMHKVHGENMDLDYMHKLKSIIDATPDKQLTPSIVKAQIVVSVILKVMLQDH